jgi:hypothetical protein
LENPDYDPENCSIDPVAKMALSDDWKKRITIVGYLHAVNTEACVDVLLGELCRVRSTNKTRPYLLEVIRTLSCMPLRLVGAKLQALAEDDSLTPWVRTGIRTALDNFPSL